MNPLTERRLAMKRNLVSLAVLLSLSSFAAGCATSPTVDQVRWEIERRVPGARFEREEHIRLGRISMGLIRGLVRMVPGKVDGQGMITQVHRIEVATYRVSDLPDLSEIDGELRFEDRLARSGWSLTVRNRETGERAWMFTRADSRGSLRNLFVVNLDGSELTLVRIDGRLDRAFAEAVAMRPKDAVRKVKGEAGEEPPPVHETRGL
jgi:ribosomal protein L18E